MFTLMFDLPFLRNHIITNFRTVTENGRAICRLSAIANMSPQTLNNANIPGITDVVNIVIKIMKARRFAKNFCRRFNLSSGQRPRIFREIRFIPIAQSKST